MEGRRRLPRSGGGRVWSSCGDGLRRDHGCRRDRGVGLVDRRVGLVDRRIGRVSRRLVGRAPEARPFRVIGLVPGVGRIVVR
jgi:hypothetical protein